MGFLPTDIAYFARYLFVAFNVVRMGIADHRITDGTGLILTIVSVATLVGSACVDNNAAGLGLACINGVMQVAMADRAKEAKEAKEARGGR